jgi:uncharacterized OB-fold protein
MSTFTDTTITFPYKRSLGPVMGAFMTALTEKRILGIRSGDGVLVPPMEWDPKTGAELARDFVEVGPVGTVTAWTWVAKPSIQHPLDHPFAFASILLDGASTPLLHAVDAGSPAALSVGLRVVPRWRAQRSGRIDDIEAFVPGEVADEADVTAGASEPVTMMDYNASIAYHNPVPPPSVRAVEASREGRLLGQQCPSCSRIYAGGKTSCPVDATELTSDHEVDLAQTGTISNFTVITPVQYPGQTETEPFARVFVLIDGAAVVLGYQPVIDLPAAEVRVGRRVTAVWASPAEEEDMGGMGFGALVGWMPIDEPDVVDPDLLNRIY